MQLVKTERYFHPNWGSQCTTDVKTTITEVDSKTSARKAICDGIKAYLKGVKDLKFTSFNKLDPDTLTEFELAYELPSPKMQFGMVRDDGSGVEIYWSIAQ